MSEHAYYKQSPTCPRCGEKVEDWHDFGMHGDGDTVDVTCDECGSTYETEMNLDIHFDNRLKGEPEGRTREIKLPHPPTTQSAAMGKVGKKKAGRELDGETWDQFPDAVEGGE